MSGQEPTPEEEELFDELAAEHLAWIEQALNRAPDEMVAAVICAAACGGAVAIGIPKETFMREMGTAFDREIARQKELEEEQAN